MNKKKLAFIGIDLQKDFCDPDGKLYVPGADDIKFNLARLSSLAIHKEIPILVTMDMHQPDDVEFEEYPPHCVIGTEGSELIAAALMGKPGTEIFYYEKSTPDVFDKEKGDSRFQEKLRQLKLDRVVIYGVATDICVKAAAEGIIKMGIPIDIVTDATAGIDPGKIADTITMILEAGGDIMKTEEVINALS